jgi:hypothetical protein
MTAMREQLKMKDEARRRRESRKESTPTLPFISEIKVTV